MQFPLGYCAGHHAPDTHRFRVFTQGQKRGAPDTVKKMMKRRAAIEPVIGHIKNEHRMGRNNLAHSTGDAINAILAAAGYNFRLLLNWLKDFLRLYWIAVFALTKTIRTGKLNCSRSTTKLYFI